MDINFKRPSLEDREIINRYLSMQKTRSCEFTFANVLLWSRHFPIEYAIIEDMLVFKGIEENPTFCYPAGKKENEHRVIEILMKYCEEMKFPFQMHLVTPAQFAVLEEIYPDTFQIEYDRDQADYVYETEKLAALSGKKYHGKKNHVNKFMKTFPDWKYEKITKENLEECFQMALKWRNLNGCEADPDKHAEICVTLNALRLFEELHLIGGMLKVNNEVIAFCIAEPVCEDTLVVHIEKALAEYDGAYTMINQQFVMHEAMDYQYINREDDVGNEGLRKAKLSYRPIFLVEKGLVTLKRKKA